MVQINKQESQNSCTHYFILTKSQKKTRIHRALTQISDIFNIR